MSDNISIEEVGVEQSTPLSLEEIVTQTNILFNSEVERIVLELASTNQEEDILPF